MNGPAANADFERFVGALEYPMFVLTAAAGGERAGCLVGFATQCSIRPPRLLVCVAHANHTHRVAMAATVVAVHRLRPDQDALARLFGGRTGDEVDKFAHCEWSPGREGVPILADVPGVVVGAVIERIPLGGHTGLLLDPVDARDDGSAGQYGYRRARAIAPGHPSED